MALREKFGRLVLLDETEAGALGREYRAARLGPAGLDRFVTVLRFGPEVSLNAEATRRLMEEARLAARLQSPGLVRVLSIGRVGQTFYVSTELVEGRSVAAILERCRGDAFPFAAEHALMIASRAASALESLHGKKDDAGTAHVHGLVAPSRLMVAFDGEVKLKGLGLWPALRGTDLLPVEERRYLAPEQLAGGPGETRSDVYALGLVMLEALTGRAPDGSAPLDGLGEARITTTAGEAVPLPKPLGELLGRALAGEPAARFPGVADLRRAIDALLFSGEFTPTTFDLAFFMHTLFRDDMEGEAHALEEARRGDYREFLVEEKPAAPVPTTTEPDAGPPPGPGRAPASAPPHPVDATTEVPAPTQAEGARPTAAERPASAPGPGPDASGVRADAARAREAAARMTLGRAAAPAPGGRRGLWLLLGLLGAVIVGGGVGWTYFVRLRGPSRVVSSEETAQARVRDLETRIAQLEREKTEAEAKAADDARTTLEAQAAAGGTTVDPAAIERAQQEARQRARAEQERKQQEERGRLAEERTAEVQRLATEATPLPAQVPSLAPAGTTAAAPAATPTPAATATPTPVPAPTPTPAVPPASVQPLSPEQLETTRSAGAELPAAPAVPSPAVRRGDLVDVNDPTVTRPVLLRQPALVYPDLARQARVEGVVELKVLIDENGNVVEQVLVRSTRPNFRFESEAERHVRGRRYRPARKDGVAVRVWMPIVVNFKLAR
jgi:TonB family protein